MQGQRGEHQHGEDPPTDTSVRDGLPTHEQRTDDGHPGCQDLPSSAQTTHPGCPALGVTQFGVHLEHPLHLMIGGVEGHQVGGGMSEFPGAIGELATQRHRAPIGAPGGHLRQPRDDDPGQQGRTEQPGGADRGEPGQQGRRPDDGKRCRTGRHQYSHDDVQDCLDVGSDAYQQVAASSPHQGGAG